MGSTEDTTNWGGRPTDSVTIETAEPLVIFTNAGTVYQLDADLRGGTLVMPRRDRALAIALLELALENVRQSERP